MIIPVVLELINAKHWISSKRNALYIISGLPVYIIIATKQMICSRSALRLMIYTLRVMICHCFAMDKKKDFTNVKSFFWR